jgi:hypothetical protein
MGGFKSYNLNTVVLHCPELFTSVEMQLSDGLKESLAAQDSSFEDIIVSVVMDDMEPVAKTEDNKVFLRFNGRAFPHKKSEVSLFDALKQYFEEEEIQAEVTEDEVSGVSKFTALVPAIETPENVEEPKEDTKEEVPDTQETPKDQETPEEQPKDKKSEDDQAVDDFLKELE